jgi:hypothetical protein
MIEFKKPILVIPKDFNLVVYKFDNVLNKFYKFYKRRGKKPFPLPAGIYDITGKFNVSNFITYIDLPPKQKDNAIKKCEIKLVENPNRASIDILKRIIYIDKNIYYAAEPIRTAVLLHEYGHFLYYDENLCDLFAISKMRAKGYPKSVIAAALNSALYSDFRKNEVLKNLQKI